MKKIIVLIFIMAFSLSLFSQQKRTPLMDALEKRDTRRAIEIINSGAELNTKDRMGETPLIEASEEGLTEVVDLLVKKGANLNIGNVRNRTALICASLRGYSKIVSILVDAGASTVENKSGISVGGVNPYFK